jgi:hypothetical protein
MIAALRLDEPRRQRHPLARRKPASGGPNPAPRHRLSRSAPQPTDAPRKNRPRYDSAWRGAPMPQKDKAQVCPAAYTPDGDTKGERPNPASGRWNTDLPGGFPDAEAVFQGLSRLAGDTSTVTVPDLLRPDILQRSYPSGLQLRVGSDLRPRIDIRAGTFDLRKAETIHFTGGKGNMCPTK